MTVDIQINIDTLITSRKSIFIASTGKDGSPEISATPFLKINAKLYIFISELAAHTQNIQQSPTLSIMFAEDEQDTKNIFSRKRLSYPCIAKPIHPQHPERESILDQFEVQQGNTISVLRQLPDFHLFEIEVLPGRYIEGFGKAYLAPPPS